MKYVIIDIIFHQITTFIKVRVAFVVKASDPLIDNFTYLSPEGSSSGIYHGLDILFSSNHNIHKSSHGLCFWTSDPLINRTY